MSAVLRFLRRGSLVQRYHTEPGMAQSVGHHSYGVAVLIARFHPSPSADLLKAALFHDLAEQVVGDVPSMRKWDNPAFADLLDQQEAQVLKDVGCQHSVLSETDALWLHTCDRLDGLLWCVDQYQRSGNHHAIDIARRFAKRISQDSGRIGEWSPELLTLVLDTFSLATFFFGLLP